MKFLVALTLAIVSAVPAAATTLEVAEILADPAQYADLRLTITGELVGDYSKRGEGVWVQVNDDPFVAAPIVAGGDPSTTSTGVGALIPTDLFEAVVVGQPGRYGRTGPLVELDGIFRYHDPDRGGETYLEVEAASLVDPAREHPVPGPDRWLWVGAALLLAAISAAGAVRRSRRPAED
ncbi:MAG TPA: hypothetical protein VLB85_07735 [Acidimicrobiia bacterium]|nr:hypothetical protein [Acidimicrobiia bacterium]